MLDHITGRGGHGCFSTAVYDRTRTAAGKDVVCEEV